MPGLSFLGKWFVALSSHWCRLVIILVVGHDSRQPVFPVVLLGEWPRNVSTMAR